MRRFLVAMLLGFCVAGSEGLLWAQDSTEAWYEWAWTPIVSTEGVQISYLFYREADTVNDGVVLRLRNTNDVAVRYSFTILFRGPKDATQAEVEGRLGPGEVKTGDEDGLYWVPFREGNAVGKVGLRGIEITRMEEG